MDILITIADDQWEQFQEVAQEAVEQSWDGKYEDFATYIMTVNLENYIESQKRKQEKKMKRALASYEESMKKEAAVAAEKPHTVLLSKAQPDVALPAKKAPMPHPEKKEKDMSNKELAERIAQLEGIAVKKRTLAEAQELNDLLILLKKRSKK